MWNMTVALHDDEVMMSGAFHSMDLSTRIVVIMWSSVGAPVSGIRERKGRGYIAVPTYVSSLAEARRFSACNQTDNWAFSHAEGEFTYFEVS
eukprot:1140485-Pelagomonas_calceolata.AAC.1